MFLKVLILFSFINLGQCQEEPVIANVIFPEIKRVGMTGRLNCTVIRKGNNNVYWIHQNTQTTISRDDDVIMEDKFNIPIDGYRKFDVIYFKEGDRNTYQLVIRRLQLTDGGTYTCQIHYRGAESSQSKDGKMVVLNPPTILYSETSQMMNVQQGEDVELHCSADGYPKPNITWLRPNGKPLPKPYNRFSVNGKVLKLSSVGEEARGVYRCIADNNVKPPASFDSALYVQFKPSAKAVQSSYGQAQNRQFDVTIECRIAGFPEPDLKWYQRIEDGLEPITDDDKHNIHVLLSHDQTLSVTEFWYQLTIINVQGNDYGDYVCEGSNRLGTQQATVVLYETSECQGAWCPQESSVPGRASLPHSASLTTFLCAALAYLGLFFFH